MSSDASRPTLSTAAVLDARGPPASPQHCVYRIVVVPVEETLVDPRDNVARFMCGRKIGNAVHSLTNHQGAVVILACSLFPGLVCMMLSIVGLAPTGWYSFLLLPGGLVTIGMYSRQQIIRLLMTFNVLSFLAVTCVVTAGLIDMVLVHGDDWDRVAAVCGFCLWIGFGFLVDARPFSEVWAFSKLLMPLLYIVTTSLMGLTLLSFYTGVMSYRTRSIPLADGVSLDVATVSMSLLQVVFFFGARSVVVNLRHRNSRNHPMMLLRAELVYEPVLV